MIVFTEIASNAIEAQMPGWLNANVGGGSWMIYGRYSHRGPHRPRLTTAHVDADR